MKTLLKKKKGKKRNAKKWVQRVSGLENRWENQDW